MTIQPNMQIIAWTKHPLEIYKCSIDNNNYCSKYFIANVKGEINIQFEESKFNKLNDNKIIYYKYIYNDGKLSNTNIFNINDSVLESLVPESEYSTVNY